MNQKDIVEEQQKRNLCIGLLAHVDAGKTTLSEALLYLTGQITRLGRVDRRDCLLDHYDQERRRGITIFSKQANLTYRSCGITLLDTPGHSDFSAEMERCLQVMDAAVLVISGTDGAQAHTRTLCRLLERYSVPTLVFVSKMDVSRLSRQQLMEDLKIHVSPACVDFSQGPQGEALALCSEELLEQILENGAATDEAVCHALAARQVFPCFFGSGLKLEGVDALLDALVRYVPSPVYGADFGARVFKISRDAQGKRLTFLKITGGNLRVRDELLGEKISQLRLYSGQKFRQVDSVSAGQIAAIPGLTRTAAGQGLGAEAEGAVPCLEPVLSYSVILPAGTDPVLMLPRLQELQEEDPQLHVGWNPRLREIQIQLMGAVQTEVLKALIQERFGVDVSFASGHILYKETIAAPVEGIGHYEPLKHYAEVHLLLEPLEPNSGIVLDSNVSTDALDLNWQRLILTHLGEKQHLGVLTGSPITDMKITLIGGRAHLKHTEGGDFRQATYRALRQGLMEAESILLEPIYAFWLEVPPEHLGRAISDLHTMGAEHGGPESAGDAVCLQGTAPAAEMAQYLTQVMAYTGGRGRLSFHLWGYRECRNASAVVEASGYDPQADLENTPDSVFCAHGAGFTVPWNEVPRYCHLPPLSMGREDSTLPASSAVPVSRVGTDIDEAELEAIMNREFGPIRRKSYTPPTVVTAPVAGEKAKPVRILVDGYNVIFAWEDLNELAQDHLDAARERLITMLVNYCAVTGRELVLVFDAYGVPQGQGEKYDEARLHIVYTRQGETADSYIQQFADEVGRNANVQVVSSDSLVQLSALGSGVLRKSAREFRLEVEDALEEMRRRIAETRPPAG